MMTRRNFQKGVLSTAAIGLAFGAQAQSGFYYPDEAEPHERSFMQWPVSPIVHPDRYFLKDLQGTIADVANAIVDFEPVVMLMAKEYAPQARKMLSAQVEIWDIPTDDLWARDSGPVFVKNASGSLAVRSANFNGWGNKQTHDHDGKIAKRVADAMGLPFLNNGIVGEAGGVERAPDGVLLANRSSWINPNRNRQSEAEVTRLLLEAFGGSKMIWSNGVTGMDITDDHIDATARFTSARDVVIQLPPLSADPFARAARETYDLVRTQTNMAGEAYRVHVIDEPYDTRINSDDFVASYVNYYVCNGAVIMPQFGDAQADRKAKAVVKDAYPNREIVALNIDAIGEVGGGIHCATQQQPRGI